jgi:hypothetical protein
VSGIGLGIVDSEHENLRGTAKPFRFCPMQRRDAEVARRMTRPFVDAQVILS